MGFGEVEEPAHHCFRGKLKRLNHYTGIKNYREMTHSTYLRKGGSDV